MKREQEEDAVKVFSKKKLKGECIMVKVIKSNSKIKVESDFSKDFVTQAKTIKGRWEKPYWVFPVEQEKRLREILMEVYGEDGSSEEVRSGKVDDKIINSNEATIYTLLKEKESLLKRISEIDKAIQREVDAYAGV